MPRHPAPSSALAETPTSTQETSGILRPVYHPRLLTVLSVVVLVAVVIVGVLVGVIVARNQFITTADLAVDQAASDAHDPVLTAMELTAQVFTALTLARMGVSLRRQAVSSAQECPSADERKEGDETLTFLPLAGYAPDLSGAQEARHRRRSRARPRARHLRGA